MSKYMTKIHAKKPMYNLCPTHLSLTFYPLQDAVKAVGGGGGGGGNGQVGRR